MSSRHRRDERGQSLAVMFVLSLFALLVIAGLVVDGGAQAVAARHAEVAAQAASRAGMDAAADARLSGASGSAEAVRAARAMLAADDVAGDVALRGDTIVVDTRVSVDTTFLSLLRIDRLPAGGHAEADLRRR